MTAARALAAVVLILLAAGCGSAAHNTGSSEFGAAPGGASPSASPGSGDDAPAFAYSPSPSPTGPGPAASNGTPDLRASYHVDKGLFGAKSTVSVKLTNEGTGPAQGWTVVMGLSGVTMGVSTRPEVKHEVRDGKYVFTPNGIGSTINPGDLVDFSIDVTGLGSITSCTVNDRACTAV